MGWNRFTRQELLLNVSEIVMLLVGLPLLIHFFDHILRVSGLGMFIAITLALHYYIYKFYRDYKALILLGVSVGTGTLITGWAYLPEFTNMEPVDMVTYHLFYYEYLVYTLETGIVLYVLYSFYHCYRTNCLFNKKN
ncbi:MAG: hypothetical protein ACOY4Q_02595 [Bacillota bacterium]